MEDVLSMNQFNFMLTKRNIEQQGFAKVRGSYKLNIGYSFIHLFVMSDRAMNFQTSASLGPLKESVTLTYSLKTEMRKLKHVNNAREPDSVKILGCICVSVSVYRSKYEQDIFRFPKSKT